MDSKTVTDNANRLYNLIVRPDIKRKFGIDLDIGWAVSVGQNIMLWYYKFKTPPSKFVVRNQDESGWNENRYWSVFDLVHKIYKELIDLLGYNYHSTGERIQNSLDPNRPNIYSAFERRDFAKWKSESTNDDGDRVPPRSFILDNMSGAISKISGISYPIRDNWTIDISDEFPFFLGDIESPDWWDELSEYTLWQLENTFG